MTRPLGVILAGGLARRMGGGDKPLRDLGGRTMLDHVVARLSPQVGALALNANGDLARFASWRGPILPDSLPDHPGPLAGVLAGLDWAAEQGAERIVTVAGDTPFFPADLVARMLALQDSARIVLAGTRTAEGKIHRQPTVGLWPVDLREDLRAALQGGLRKIVLWTDPHGVAVADFPDTPFDPFFNINTPQDLALAETLLAGG